MTARQKMTASIAEYRGSGYNRIYNRKSMYRYRFAESSSVGTTVVSQYSTLG